MDIIIVKYTSSHDTDLYPCLTEKAKDKVILELAQLAIDDEDVLPEKIEEVKRLIKEKDIDGLVGDWSNLTGCEYIDWEWHCARMD